MPDGPHALLLGSWLITLRTSVEENSLSADWYHKESMLGLGWYSCCHIVLNNCDWIFLRAVQSSKCCWMCYLISDSSVIMLFCSLMLSNLTGSLCRFSMLLIIDVGLFWSLVHLLDILSLICSLMFLMFSKFRAW